MPSRLCVLTAADTAELGHVRGFFRQYAAWLGVDLSYQGFADEVANLPGAYGEADGRLFYAEVDGKPACAVIPSDRSLSMKRVAAAFGGKAATMMPPDKAERLTGFHTGGISPFGQKRQSPCAFEATALGAEEIVLNGGKRGMMVALAPAAALAAARARPAPLIAD